MQRASPNPNPGDVIEGLPETLGGLVCLLLQVAFCVIVFFNSLCLSFCLTF